ncbi:Ku protein, partial [[Kitasatospora] papulosa]
PRETELDEDEIERAVQLTDSMALDDISGFRDRYREALEELLAAKSEGKALPAAAGAEEEEPGKVMDLMAALNASVKEARQTRGEDATVHEMTPGRPRARKKAAPAGKKTAAKSASKKTASGKTTAARKQPARKTAAKKRTAS